ncbi:auxin-responsive protein IAA31-like [Bidens hawaiensis]|uniref:auxin-responsive protein IAA31-like n=1 Tax=Bidens hawaiensis TaxID=980011 RepID=UPI00404993C7
MELQLTLSLSSSSYFSQFDLNKHYSHDNVEAKDNVYECLSMQPLKKRKKACVNGDANDVESKFMFIKHKFSGQETSLVGWPPVNKSSKKLCGGGVGGTKPKSMFVKVHMEGYGIARKINLNQHRSYRTLVHTLAHMFGKCKEDVKLTYQDKEGDWLLAGDVPWGSFMEAVKRLKLLKNTC